MSPLRPSRVLALVVALLMLAAGCGSDEPPALITSGANPATAPKDLVDSLEAQGLTSLVSALGAAELEDTLRGEGPFTVFAPSEAAWSALPEGLLPLLLDPANRGLLTDILEQHVVEGLTLAAELADTTRLTTLEGSSLTVRATEEAGEEGAEPTVTVEVGGAALSDTDLFATNGVIHVIDQVLVPSDRADDLDELIESIPEVTDLVTTLENTSTVSSFVELLDQAGLLSDLDSDGPFTVFAPSNQAIARLTAAQRQLLEEQPELLEALVKFHVVRQSVLTSELLTGRYLTTLEGEGVRIRNVGRGSSFTFGDATITTTDIVATNGVVHVIDQVLIPASITGPGGF
jgi:transforming growth factor-beta-induced protein